MKRTGRTFAATAGICFGAICFAQETAPIQAKVVKGMPFSAQVVTKSIQVLADGNSIARISTAMLARDSNGRTRREQKLSETGSPSDQPTASVVFIQDPTAAINLVLETRSRSVLRIMASEPQPAANGGGAPNTKKESLGTQIIEGVEAEGTRITQTIAADTAGNELPLDVVLETWYSSAIETVVMSRSIDPRLGETTFNLTNIQRIEPDRSLFEVPADYRIIESQNGQR